MAPQKHPTNLKAFTTDDVTSLCNAAQAAWNRASDRAKCVVFRWRGARYQSTLTSFRMLIHTDGGEPVAERYHQ